jgi:hypothetical protein
MAPFCLYFFLCYPSRCPGTERSRLFCGMFNLAFLEKGLKTASSPSRALTAMPGLGIFGESWKCWRTSVQKWAEVGKWRGRRKTKRPQPHLASCPIPQATKYPTLHNQISSPTPDTVAPLRAVGVEIPPTNFLAGVRISTPRTSSNRRQPSPSRTVKMVS